MYRLGSGLGLVPVFVYFTDCTPAVDSGPVTLCGPLALYGPMSLYLAVTLSVCNSVCNFTM